ncbi:MAG TPA: VWA domain-containing protein [Chitinophagales bacterium]|nr:VWA domain-containing protein [Chitinophagales bacterium]
MAHHYFSFSFFSRLFQFICGAKICLWYCTAHAQTPFPNPDLIQTCPYDIIFVLDESGSIVGSSRGTTNIASEVRNGARDLITALNGTGSRVAVVEFNTNARRALIGGLTTYQTINNAYIDAFNNYITQDNNTVASASNYDPEDYSCPGNQCYTNWEAAFNQVEMINATAGLADLVIFFTDGMPTAYITSSGGVAQGIDAATTAQALLEAIGAANAVKAQGSHIFVVGIPNPSLPESNVQAISGPDKYPVPQPDLLKGDYTVSSSATLQQDLAGIAAVSSCDDDDICTADQCLNGGCIYSSLSIQSGDSVTICSNESYFAGGQWRNVSGTYIDTYANTAGCDSIITTFLTVIPIKQRFLRVPICQGDSIYAGGYYRTTSGVYHDTFTAANGCDSIFTTIVVIPNCNDGDLCTDDFCDNGACGHTPVNCDDGDPCTTDGCRVVCIHVPLNCNDGSVCTADTCINGICGHDATTVEAGIHEVPDFCQGTSVNLEAVSPAAVSYQWSTGETTATISAAAGGVYMVTVYDSNGCEGSASFAVGSPDDIFGAYTIVAQKKVNLNLNTVFSGGIGATTPFGIVISDSSFITAPATFVKADSIVISGTGGAVQQISSPASIVLPPYEPNPYSGPNITVPASSVLTLSDSVYGVVTIGKVSVITFTSPVVNIRSLTTREKVTLKFAPCTHLRVANKINLGILNNFNPDGNEVVVYCGYGVKVEGGSAVTADIYVKNGNLTVLAASPAKPNRMTGSFIANEVYAEDYTHWHQNTVCDNPCQAGAPLWKLSQARVEHSWIDKIFLQAYPNPFSHRLNIEFTLPEDSHVRLDVFAITGQKLATLVDGEIKSAILNKTEYGAKEDYSGVIVLRMMTSQGVVHRRFVQQ